MTEDRLMMMILLMFPEIDLFFLQVRASAVVSWRSPVMATVVDIPFLERMPAYVDYFANGKINESCSFKNGEAM
ncbi:hypothetical protein ODZ84_22970 [Chryseobacterium fluminis]|uniref:hypothetical protein n=1 Tax=Chryseobacterium fluminis TaxID=2983606 RepID=UPI0022516762|nr:hypothetical protein [Chryseobacterium sp. MMS21-Ot14]UZT97989.1 hypothetical protein ODZ84_22970 [Chryseobacterium sp. MMS21-Ot14]